MTKGTLHLLPAGLSADAAPESVVPATVLDKIRSLGAFIAEDAKTARAWLFGTNTRLDDRAPIEVLGAAKDTADFAMVVRAARQVASFQS